MAFSGRDLFDLTMVVTAVACTLLARRIGPFFRQAAVYALCGAALTASTVLMFASCWLPGIAPAVGLPARCWEASASRLLILFWSELYGCLNPLRVALYYSASIVVGALVLYVYRGVHAAVAVRDDVPAAGGVARACCAAGSAASRRPSCPRRRGRGSRCRGRRCCSWRPTRSRTGSWRAGCTPARSDRIPRRGRWRWACSCFLGVAVRGGRFDFGIIYRVALPLMVVALFLLPTLGHVQGMAASFCVSAGYTAQSVLIMLIMANICYRYGVSALWLFGIERSVRQVSMWLGRLVADGAQSFDVLGGNGELFISLLTVVAIVTATTILFSERDLSSRWGANFLAGGTDSAAMIRKQELADRCAEVARAYKLSTREEEVLLLLAQRKTVGIIERELFIANGTAKAHVRHIYQKLDIHTRQELFDLLGVEAREGGKGAGATADEGL